MKIIEGRENRVLLQQCFYRIAISKKETFRHHILWHGRHSSDTAQIGLCDGELVEPAQSILHVGERRAGNGALGLFPGKPILEVSSQHTVEHGTRFPFSCITK